MIIVEPEVDKLIKAIEYDLGKELSPLLMEYILEEINPSVLLRKQVKAMNNKLMYLGK